MKVIAASRLGVGLERDMGELESENTVFDVSPYDPQRGINMGRYQALKKGMRKKINETIKQVKEYRKASPDVPLEDTYQGAYRRTLEMLFVQTAREEQDMLRLDKLIAATGKELAKETISQAILNHIKRTAFMYSKNPSPLPAIKNKIGIELTFDQEHVDNMAKVILERNNTPYALGRELVYLYHLTGQKASNFFHENEMYNAMSDRTSHEQVMRMIGEI